MAPQTWVKMDLREKEVERLCDDVKRRISELQLAILSGTLTEAGLVEASEQLATLRKQLAGTLDRSLKEQTTRRVRTAEENTKQARPA
jgi:hypothetical protein